MSDSETPCHNSPSFLPTWPKGRSGSLFLRSTRASCDKTANQSRQSESKLPAEQARALLNSMYAERGRFCGAGRSRYVSFKCPGRSKGAEKRSARREVRAQRHAAPRVTRAEAAAGPVGAQFWSRARRPFAAECVRSPASRAATYRRVGVLRRGSECACHTVLSRGAEAVTAGLQKRFACLCVPSPSSPSWASRPSAPFVLSCDM